MTFTTDAIAERCGVSAATVTRWAVQWHGPLGSGRRRQHSLADARVARAWAVIQCTIDPNIPAPNCRMLYDLADAAIRRNPSRRWLLLSELNAETFRTAGEAALAWQDSGEIAARIIDLDANAKPAVAAA